MSTEERTKHLEFAEWQLQTGGRATDKESARDMACIVRRIGGAFPVTYPRIGGGCFVASIKGEIEEILPCREGES